MPLFFWGFRYVYVGTSGGVAQISCGSVSFHNGSLLTYIQVHSFFHLPTNVIELLWWAFHFTYTFKLQSFCFFSKFSIFVDTIWWDTILMFSFNSLDMFNLVLIIFIIINCLLKLRGLKDIFLLTGWVFFICLVDLGFQDMWNFLLFCVLNFCLNI
jgi:hypothetical protein